MANFKISDLPETITLNNTDIVEVSVDTGGGSFDSNKITVNNLKTELGIGGIDGKTVLNGTVDPTSEGVDGDFYINTTSNEIFGPKTGGAWGTGTSLVGPQGPQGPAGADGVSFNTMFISGTVEDSGTTVKNTPTTIVASTLVSSNTNVNNVWESHNGSLRTDNWTDAFAAYNQFTNGSSVRKTILTIKCGKSDSQAPGNEDTAYMDIIIDWDNNKISGSIWFHAGGDGSSNPRWVISEPIGSTTTVHNFTKLTNENGDYTLPAIGLNPSTHNITEFPALEDTASERDFAYQIRLDEYI